MCRLLMAIGIDKDSPVEKFMLSAKESMSWANKDGIGYTAVNSDKNMFTERWHNNDMLLTDKGIDAKIAKELLAYRKQLGYLVGQNYELKGKKQPDITSFTMHTRMATCDRTFENVHPFVDNKVSLVHNGVISNSLDLALNKISTCDSEVALQTYISLDITNHPERAQEWLDMLKGYWAFGIFSQDSSGKSIVDIIRNDANLVWSNVDGMGLVFATNAYILGEASRGIGANFTVPEDVPANTLYRFDAITGELIKSFELKDSKLNKVFVPQVCDYKGKHTNYRGERISMFDDEDEYDAFGFNTKILNKAPKVAEKLLIDEIVDRMPVEITTLDELLNFCDDENEPLIDRLDLYDKQFDTNYCYQYESLPSETQLYIESLVVFDEIIEEIAIYYEICFESKES